MKLETRMRQSIKRRVGNVVLREEIAQLGSKTQVTHVLKALIEEGTITRLAPGVFAKARKVNDDIQISGDVASVLAEASEKLGIVLHKETFPKDLNSSSSSEVVIETDTPRISRKMVINGVEIKFRSVKSARHARFAKKHKSVASYVEKLARQHKVYYVENSMDSWAGTVTRLAGDYVKSDRVENLLVALKRAGKISKQEVASLAVNYLRERKQGVRSI